MAILEILTYPDPRLSREADDVTDFDDPAFQQLVDDLEETMEASPGCVGVAAPQAGRLVRLLVMDCGLARKPMAGHHGRLIVVNPEILKWAGMEVAREGCLSLPDYTGNVMRAVEVKVRFQDRRGRERIAEFTGFEARLYQHEADHLDGKLFLDRVVSRKADLFKRKNYGQAKK